MSTFFLLKRHKSVFNLLTVETKDLHVQYSTLLFTSKHYEPFFFSTQTRFWHIVKYLHTVTANHIPFTSIFYASDKQRTLNILNAILKLYGRRFAINHSFES